MLAEVVYSLVLKSDGIEHTRRGLCHARIRVSLTRMQRRSLDEDSTKTVEVDEVTVFEPVTKGSRGGHHGVLNREPSADMYLCLEHD